MGRKHFAFWRTPLGIRIGGFTFERTLEWVVNDGLMVIFFFVVGMEIRREMHEGAVGVEASGASSCRCAGRYARAGRALSRACRGWSGAFGLGGSDGDRHAFAVGILTLLGKRVPAALRVLLLALAVIDDLGAIVVIALFYSSGIEASGLLVAALGFAGVFALQRFGVRARLAYVAPSVVAWGGIYAAGIHPTIAGVIVGLVTPVRAWFGSVGFVAGIHEQLAQLEGTAPDALSSDDLDQTLDRVGLARREALSPADSLIRLLHPWVAFGILPVFALANAGVVVAAGSLDAVSWHVASGVCAGLMFGKPLGVLLASWLTLRLRIGPLPAGMTMRHLVVLGIVAGVGFTMALFIAQLAFSHAKLLGAAKLGVLAGSGGAAIVGLALGRVLLTPWEEAVQHGRQTRRNARPSADEGSRVPAALQVEGSRALRAEHTRRASTPPHPCPAPQHPQPPARGTRLARNGCSMTCRTWS